MHILADHKHNVITRTVYNRQNQLFIMALSVMTQRMNLTDISTPGDYTFIYDY